MSPKTEMEKMLAGEMYNCLDPALDAEREKAKRLFRRFNQCEDPVERHSIIKNMVGSLGENSLIEPPFFCSYGMNIYIGDNVFLNYMCNILDNNDVRIGNHVAMGPFVQIYTAAHSIYAELRNRGMEEAIPITIEDNVWIGGNAILLPGVTVGKNSVIGAGAVVSRSIPPNSIAVGNPAKVIKEIEQ